VELALILFILLLLVAGVIDFGRAFNSYIVITNASREGARFASRFPNEQELIREAAKQETAGSSVELDDDNIDIVPDPSGPTVASGTAVTVTVTYTVPTIIADIAGFGYLPLRAQTAMVVFGLDEDPGG
jgi:hypothetical protein